MKGAKRLLFWAMAGVILLRAAPLLAAAPVSLELAAEPQGDPLAQQEWARRLGQAGVYDLRIRAAMSGDEPRIERRGSPQAPSYAVTAILRSTGQIEVPGARFGASETGALVQWLSDLGEQGPADQRPARTALGLTAEQLVQVRGELAAKVGFATAGMAAGDVFRRIASGLPRPLRIEADLLGLLEPATVGEDLSGLARGTSLAYVLSQAGLILLVQELPQGLEYAVARQTNTANAWPIGWNAEKSPPQLLPALYEMRNINVQGVPARQVLQAITGRVSLVALADTMGSSPSLDELDKTIVTLPVGRGTYAQTLSRALFKARLKYELRLDDAGTPFVWLSRVGG